MEIFYFYFGAIVVSWCNNSENEKSIGNRLSSSGKWVVYDV